MKKINKTEWIAIGAGIAFVAYLFYGGSLISLFNMDNSQDQGQDALPESGVRTEEVREGTGEAAAVGDRLTVHYIGSLPGGKVFDSSVDRNTPFVFTLGVGQVIRGWDEGLVGMREGEVRRVIIAPDFGYGAQGAGTIPPNSTLIFEVELLDVEKSQ
ncbi:MAG: FKBP-type peptidyl-prolyl cis-trans isomerase [bacterium]|nr:FKBP-type peptidyl-prolyl cis-trans isomerase [bacterium]